MGPSCGTRMPACARWAPCSIFVPQVAPGERRIPHFSSRESWYDTLLLKGKTIDKEIAYRTQASEYKRVFAQCGVKSTKVRCNISGHESADIAICVYTTSDAIAMNTDVMSVHFEMLLTFTCECRSGHAHRARKWRSRCRGYGSK